jgi:hypothetical protein
MSHSVFLVLSFVMGPRKHSKRMKIIDNQHEHECCTLICHYIITIICLVPRPGDGFNPKHGAEACESDYKLCFN